MGIVEQSEKEKQCRVNGIYRRVKEGSMVLMCIIVFELKLVYSKICI